MFNEIEIEIDDDLIAQFEALGNAANRNPWTPEKEALLMKYWPVKNHEGVAKLLGISTGTCLKRYGELSSKQE